MKTYTVYLRSVTAALMLGVGIIVLASNWMITPYVEDRVSWSPHWCSAPAGEMFNPCVNLDPSRFSVWVDLPGGL